VVVAAGITATAIVMTRETEGDEVSRTAKPVVPADAPMPADAPIVTAREAVPVDSSPPEIQIKLDSKPPGASVWRDGRNLGVTPFTDRMPAGDGTLRYTLTAKGFRDVVIQATQRESFERTTTMEPLRQPERKKAERPVGTTGSTKGSNATGDVDAVNPFR
jgi:hypothetical protein